MPVYAGQAKDMELIEHAIDIRMPAQIRAGELLAEIDKNRGAPRKTGSAVLPVLNMGTVPPTRVFWPRRALPEMRTKWRRVLWGFAVR